MTDSESPAPAAGGKGRPTPTRKEAEAARLQRARAAVDKKAARQLEKQRRIKRNQEIRAGIKAGDERYLPKRDQGPVRRFIRDWIDSRIVFAEIFMPMLVLILILQLSGQEALVNFSLTLWTVSILVVLGDIVRIRILLRKRLKAEFGPEALKGATFYAITRALQFRFMRVPKPTKKIGDAI